jgi:hypothetical protein
LTAIPQQLVSCPATHVDRFSSPNVVRLTTSKRARWELIAEMRKHIILVETPQRKHVGRCRNRWGCSMKTDIRE